MGKLKTTACMKFVTDMPQDDQDALLERLDKYQAAGVPAELAQVMAASDTLSELRGERQQFMQMLRESHPELFMATPSLAYSAREPQEAAVGDKTDVSKLPVGKPVPADVRAAGLRESMEFAAGKSYSRGRDFKMDLQSQVLAEARRARVKLDEHTQENLKHLAKQMADDAVYALRFHENAIGWYDKHVSRAIGAVSVIHPEVDTDADARTAFLWTLAVTSNGLRVSQNFQLAEKAYQGWKSSAANLEDRLMPTDIGAGTARTQINDGLAYYNEMVEKMGHEKLRRFMVTRFTVGELSKSLGFKVSGEWMDTPVMGAAVIGPKIGNGFYANLNGFFDSLTIDRWNMRTYGRMTGTLIGVPKEMVEKGRDRLRNAVNMLDKAERASLSKLIGHKITSGMSLQSMDKVAAAIQKASIKPEPRSAMSETDAGNEVRKAGVRLASLLDGQKEAPSGPSERNWIRAISAEALSILESRGTKMTMADMQALLWYGERRLYDTSKVPEGERLDDYEDGEAPDYANAAMELAISLGHDKAKVESAMDAAEREGTRRTKPMSDEERAEFVRSMRPAPAQGRHAIYEVAPDPNDAELVAQWRSLDQKARRKITDEVRKEMLDAILKAIGVKVKGTVATTGAYGPDINPSLLTEYKLKDVSFEQAQALAAAVGYVFDQDSVALVDPRVEGDAGVVRVEFAGKPDKFLDQIYAAVRAVEPRIDGFTLRGKSLDFLNFHEADGLTNADLARKINDAINGINLPVDHVVTDGRSKSTLIEKDQYGRHLQGLRPQADRGVQRELDRLRDRSRDLVRAGLRANVPGGARPESGRAGNPRYADGLAPQAEGGAGGGAGRYSLREDSPLPGAPDVPGWHGPDPALAEVAKRYAAENGIDLRRQAEYVDVDESRALRLAAAYEAMPHAPNDPRVKEAYENLIRQTVAQYRALEKAGYKFYLFDSGADPYAGNPWNAMRDLKFNKVMGVYSTKDGFGSDEKVDVSNNPLLADTGIKWPLNSLDGKLEPVLANDLFRAVHDAFGHGLEGAGFRARGEENAWQAHVRLFTGSAVGAITSETRGQNSWLNYGPYGEQNRTANVFETNFADQKTGLMPEWTWTEGRAGDLVNFSSRDVTETPEFKRWFGDSKVVDGQGKPLVVYHGTRPGVEINEFRARNESDGIYFTPDPLYAEGFTEDVFGDSGAKGAIYPVYLSVSNPYVVRASDIDSPEAQKFLYRGHDRAELERSGYDGAMLYLGGELDQIIAFRPDQIKSAIGNNGNFDPANPDVRYSSRDQLGMYSALERGVESLSMNQSQAGGWKAALKGLVNKGLAKQDEIEWSGIEDWLDLQEGKVTKDQVLEYLGANGVRVEEVTLGGEFSFKNSDDALKYLAGQAGSTVDEVREDYGYTDDSDYITLANEMAGQGEDNAPRAKYGSYTLPGGANYREVLLTLPDGAKPMTYQEWVAGGMVGEWSSKGVVATKPKYQSSHWEGVPNVLAHIRLNDRTDADGKRVLFVEEIQSDWGQEGKKKGFKPDVTTELPSQFQLFNGSGGSEGVFETEGAARARMAELNGRRVPSARDPLDTSNWTVRTVRLQSTVRGIPAAPFVTKTEGWLNLALKRVIAMAVDGGYDRVAFVNGKQSAERYDLSKQVKSLGYDPKSGRLQAFDEERSIVIDESGIPPERLEDYIGKEVAQRLLSTELVMGKHLLDGEQLKVGGEGMMTFYDQIVPAAVKKLLPKVGGGQMQSVRIVRDMIPGIDVSPGQRSADQPGFDVTDAMREKVGGEGLPRFSSREVTETPEFQRWFGDSKVVDAEGKPLVVYHGTTADFSVFNVGKRGAFFSSSPASASAYAGSEGGSNVIPAYLSLKNPYTGHVGRKGPEIGAVIAAARRGGHDGAVVTYDDFPGETAYVAFHPEQIKSAIGNTGSFDPENPDIRFSGRTWGIPEMSKFDDLVYKMQNKHVDTKRVIQAIEEAGGALTDETNPYLQEELFHGRAAKRVNDFAADELKPLMQQMGDDGLEMAEVEEFLHARHAKEANRIIAERNPGVPGLQDGGSGMTDAAADAYMASLTPEMRAKLQRAAGMVDAIIAKTRQLYADYGLESQATVDGWADMFQHYIPLMREQDGEDRGMGIGQGFSVKGREVKGRTGSTRKVVDVLANIAMQRERLIVRGEKNRVAQALVGLVASNPNQGFWHVGPPPAERVYDPKTNTVVDRVDPLYKSRPNVIVAKLKDPVAGDVREMAVVFNEADPRAMRMAQSMKNLDAAGLEGLLGVSAKITRYFAAVNTQYNPVFGVVNLVRDVQGALVNLDATPLAKRKSRIARDTISALSGIYADLRAIRHGKHPTSQWSQLWEEFQREGGQTGFRDMFASSKDRADALQRALDPMSWTNSKLGRFFKADGALKVPLEKAQQGVTWLFGWLSDYNESMENGVRLATYKAALDQGMSKEQAASLAKNLTVNFNRKGQIGQQAGALYAFFNAAMQGTARIGSTIFTMDRGDVRTMRLSGTGKKVVYGGMLLGAMQALALAAAGFDDEDPPEFVRERSLVIPVGGGKYVSIPMPLGLHVIPGLGRHMTEFALGGFKDPAKRTISIMGMFADAFNPIGNAGMSIQTISPTAIDPFVALTENKDWTGKPIARISSNKAMPGHLQAKDTASVLGKTISEAINGITGGNAYVAGALSPTPDQVDYLIGQVLGGVGRELSKLEQSAKAVSTGESLPTHKVPLVGRFVGDTRGQASEGGRFYANLDRLNALETEIKGLRKDGKAEEAAALMSQREDAVLVNMANVVERQVQRLRREKRELIARGAPREQVRAKEAQITDAMARLNRAVERLKTAG